jgi:hypothetical protein
MLIGLAGVAGLAAAGVATTAHVDGFVRQWITALIRAHLQGASIPQAAIDAFVAEVAPAFSVRHRAVAVFRTVLPGQPIAVASLERGAKQLERDLLSKFIVGSNFFSIDPEREPVEYAGDWICANPFARFDFDEA